MRFMAADFRDFKLDQAVDAIVGRLVLMYAADPVDALRRALRNLKGGWRDRIAGVHHRLRWSRLHRAARLLAAKAVEWFRAGFKHAGVQPRMGMRLFGVMRAAGLDPSPDIDMLVPIQQGPQGALFRSLTAVVRSQIPAIVASGAATLAEIDIDTLEQG